MGDARGYIISSMRPAASRGLAPWASPGARTLILGSFPSRASLQGACYYGHPRNHFWPILAAVYGKDPGRGSDERKAFALERGLAIWDVLASCSRPGSLDQDISLAAPNPLGDFLEGLPCLERVLLNGSYAARAFQNMRRRGGAGKRDLDSLIAERNIIVLALPSTSPVPSRSNRRREDKLPAWRAALRG